MANILKTPGRDDSYDPFAPVSSKYAMPSGTTTAANATNMTATGNFAGYIPPTGGTGGLPPSASILPGPGKGGDYDVPASKSILENYFTNAIGRPSNPGEVDSILAGQGLKPGGNSVGYKNLGLVLDALSHYDRVGASNFGPVETSGGKPIGPDGILNYTDTDAYKNDPYGGGEIGGGGPEGFDFSGIFDDPSTALYEGIIRKRLAALGQPLNIPGLADYQSRIQNRMGQLESPLPEPPEVTAYKQLLGTMGNETFKPNTELETVLKAITGRIDQLNAPPFTSLEEKGQEVKAYDQLEHDKQAARQQVAERLGSRGIGAGSGILEAAIQQSDRAFDALKARNTNELLQYRTDVGESRKNQAITYGTSAAGLRGGELTREQQFTQGQQGLKLSASGTSAQIAQAQQGQNESRANQIVTLAGALADLGFNVENLTNARGVQELQTASLLPDLVERRLMLALSTLNGGQVNLAPLGSQIGGFAQQAGYNRVNAPTEDNSWLAQLGALIPGLVK